MIETVISVTINIICDCEKCAKLKRPKQKKFRAPTAREARILSKQAGWAHKQDRKTFEVFHVSPDCNLDYKIARSIAMVRRRRREKQAHIKPENNNV